MIDFREEKKINRKSYYNFNYDESSQTRNILK